MAATFESLSDELLLKIAGYLRLSDRLSLGRTSVRFPSVCHDKQLQRSLCISREWAIDADSLNVIFKHNAKAVHHLDFAHCYWLPTKTISKYVVKCSNVIKLDLRDCSISPKALNNILSVTRSLKHLAVNDGGVLLRRKTEAIPSFVKKLHPVQEISENTWETLQGLEEVVLYIGKCTKDLYVIRLCNQLKSVSLVTASYPSRSSICHCCLNYLNIALSLDLNQFHVELPLHSIHPKLIDEVSASHKHFKKQKSLVHFIRDASSGEITSLSSCPSRYQNAYDMDEIAEVFLRCDDKLQCLHLRDWCGDWCNGGQGKLAANLDRFKFITCLQLPVKELENVFKVMCHDLCVHLKLHMDTNKQCLTTPHQRRWTIPDRHPDYENLSDDVARSVGDDLISLSLQACFLLNQTCLQEREVKKRNTFNEVPVMANEFGKQQRVGMSTSQQTTNPDNESHEGNLKKYVLSAPFLEIFELIGEVWDPKLLLERLIEGLSNPARYTCRVSHNVNDNFLSCVSQWKQLTSLTLVGLPGIRHGHWLTAITRKCPRLSFLSLSRLGLLGGCVYSKALCEALTYAKNLQDLRLEQPYLRLNPALCTALQSCQKLQRLVIIAHKEEFSHQGVLNVFHHCKQLFVFVLLTGDTITACNALSKQLSQRYQMDRPALSLCIKQYRGTEEVLDVLKKVPWIHFKEMVLVKSQVCDRPHGWTGLSPV